MSSSVNLLVFATFCFMFFGTNALPNDEDDVIGGGSLPIPEDDLPTEGYSPNYGEYFDQPYENDPNQEDYQPYYGGYSDQPYEDDPNQVEYQPYYDSVCGMNEEWMWCGPSYEKSCANLDEEDVFYLDQCTEQCYCRPGLVRDWDQKGCIEPQSCSVDPYSIADSSCTQDQEWLWCGPAHEKSCANLNDEDVVYTGDCVEKCFCKAGFVRDFNEVDCTKPQLCSSSEPTSDDVLSVSQPIETYYE